MKNKISSETVEQMILSAKHIFSMFPIKDFENDIWNDFNISS